jgi:hypothetical protein
MKFKNLIFILILNISLISTQCYNANESNHIDNAKQLIELFCKFEFEGFVVTDQREMIIKFSKEREEKERKRRPIFKPWVVLWDSDPYFIISSYKVLNIELSGNKGIATVGYKRIGECKGNAQINSSLKEQDIVKLNLIYDGKRWWILDPPPPKVYLNVLIKIFEDDFKRINNQEWLQNASIGQQQYFSKMRETINILKNLKK